MLTGSDNMDFYTRVIMPVLKPNLTVAGFSLGLYIGAQEET